MAGDASDTADGPAGRDAGASDQTHGFADYARVLRQHRHFRYLWIAETIDNVGSWLSYVATLGLATEFSGGSGLAISGVVLIRFLPSLLLAPVCGVVADRVNRVRVLTAAAAADAAIVALLALVSRPSQAPLLYGLITLQFAAAAFFDPARKALVPVLVPAADLHLATTIDSFAWSITGAVGASAGGVVASRLGKQACFLIDACTYLAAAWCATQLPPSLGAPDAASRLLAKHKGLRQVELAGVLEGGQARQQVQGLPEAVPAAGRDEAAGAPGRGAALAAAAAAALADGWRATREGWAYLSSPANRDVAALVLMKCAAALVWGAVDILNVKFSEMESMQALGDASTTLGLIFASVGLGCFVGPLAMNRFVPPRPAPLRSGVAASYCLFFLGLLVMLLSPNIGLVLLSTFVRSMGSATLWVYSTLLMQQRVPNELLGRMSATESALFTVTETVSSLFGGASFDLLRLSLHTLLLILTTAAGALAAVWIGYAWLVNSGAEGGDQAGYRPVRQTDEHDGDRQEPR